MKKSVILVSLLALMLVSANTVMAKPEKWESNPVHGSQEKKTGLENALKHVKNPKARAAIKRAMERQKQKVDQPEMTDAQIVAADKAALTIGFNGSDSLTSVTQALKLPIKGEYGSTVTWTSSNTAVISHDGKTVTRPTTGDAKVTLTATIKKNNVSVTKTFEVTVKAKLTDIQIVAADKAALTIGYSGSDSATAITSPLKLAVKGTNGSAITWTSSAPSIISHDGKTVNQPAAGQGDAVVTLIAHISSNGVSDVKVFTVVVKQQMNDVDQVAADKAALTIGFSEGDSANSVTSKLSFATVGTFGSSITWVSSSPTVISHDGKTVNRPAAGQGDVYVTLIATIKSNTVTDAKTFTVLVKQQLTDAQKVAADKAALSIGFSGTDTASNVTSKLTLPTVGANGSMIVWYSSNTSIIADNGVVYRPAAGSGDKSVKLTAIILSKTAADTKEFTVTVKQLP